MTIYYEEVGESELEATVRAILRDFLALVTLELELVDHDQEVELDQTSEILAGLKYHSSLTNVSVCLEPYIATGVDEIEVDDFFRMLQSDLGPNISVTEFHPPE